MRRGARADETKVATDDGSNLIQLRVNLWLSRAQLVATDAPEQATGDNA